MLSTETKTSCLIANVRKKIHIFSNSIFLDQNFDSYRARELLVLTESEELCLYWVNLLKKVIDSRSVMRSNSIIHQPHRSRGAAGGTTRSTGSNPSKSIGSSKSSILPTVGPPVARHGSESHLNFPPQFNE